MQTDHAHVKAGQQLALFVSYGRDEDATQFVEKLLSDLGRRGFDRKRIFVDRDSIGPGEKFNIRIESGIRDADVLAAVLSHHSLRDESVCHGEVVYALNACKLVVPVQFLDDPTIKPGIMLCHRNWIDLSPQNYQRGLDSLCRLLRGDESVLLPPRLPSVTGVEPFDFGPEIARFLVNFIERHWLLQKIDDWIGTPESSRMFVLVGDAGVGKSAIAAWLSQVHRDDVVAIHFCTNRTVATSNPHRFVASLVAQLDSQMQDYAAALRKREPERGRRTAADAFRELIVEPMNYIWPREPKLIVVDSLDEAQRQQQGETVADVLQRHAQELPDWLRIFATTRPDDPVLAKIEPHEKFVIRASAERNKRDVRRYVSSRVRSQSDARQSAVDAGKVDRRVADFVAGNFEFARLVVDAIEQGFLKLDQLPGATPNLRKFYKDSFQRQFKTVARYKRTYAPLLGALAVAREPLTFQTLQCVSGESPARVADRLEEVQRYLRRSGTRSVPAFELAHQSIGDWLLTRSESGDFACDVKRCSARLCDAILGDGQDDVYQRRHLAQHLVAAERMDQLVDCLTSNEFTGHVEALESCVQALVALDTCEVTGQRWAGQSNPCSQILERTWAATGGECAQLFLRLADACEVLARWARAQEVLLRVRNLSVEREQTSINLRATVALAQLESARGNTRDALLHAMAGHEIADLLYQRAAARDNPDAALELMRAKNSLGRAWFDMGNSWSGNADSTLGDYPKRLVQAEKLFREVVQMNKKCRPRSGASASWDRQMSRALSNLGVIKRLRGMTRQARKLQQDAYQLREKLRDPRAEAWSLRDLGWLDWDEGKKVKARKRFEQALALAQRAQEPQLMLWVLRDLEQWYRDNGREPRDHRIWRERVFEALGSLPATNVFYDLAGYFPSKKGAPIRLEQIGQHAGSWYDKAFRLCSRRKKPWSPRAAANALRGRAWAQSDLAKEDLAGAAALLIRECELRSQLENAEPELVHSLWACLRLGQRAMTRGDLALSDQLHQHVLGLAQHYVDEREIKKQRSLSQSDMQRVAAAACHGLGSLRLDSNADAALEYFTRARKIREVSDRSRLAGTIMRIGSCYADQGQFPQAEKHFEEAINVAQQWCDAETEASAWRLLCRVVIDHRNPARDSVRARQCAEKAVHVARFAPLNAVEQEAIDACADCEFNAGRLDKASKLYKQALGLNSERIWDQCRCLLSLAMVTAHRGSRNLSRAEKWCQQAGGLLHSEASPRLQNRVRLVEAYLKSLRQKSGAVSAYDELREFEFPWLPDAPLG